MAAFMMFSKIAKGLGMSGGHEGENVAHIRHLLHGAAQRDQLVQLPLRQRDGGEECAAAQLVSKVGQSMGLSPSSLVHFL
jgi:hypothetical protein